MLPRQQARGSRRASFDAFGAKARARNGTNFDSNPRAQYEAAPDES
jgi:hypothetical protein